MRTHVTPEYAAPLWKSGNYTYDAAGNITAIGTAAAKSSDGRTNTYTYDADSRLTGWTDSTLASPESYSYDVYGNMTSVTRYTGTTTAIAVDPLTNHVQAGQYGHAGNLKNDDSNRTYTYDSENMIAQSTSTTEGTSYYVYGPDDERIGVLASNPASTWTWSARGMDGQVLRQFRSMDGSPTWVWVEDYVYRSGTLVAAERPPEEGGQRHFHLDHLSTPRMITGRDGRLVAYHDYNPYGYEVTASGSSPCTEMGSGFDRDEPKRFTMHERDFSANCNDRGAGLHAC